MTRDALGDVDERVRLFINDEEVLTAASYEINIGILTQPSQWSMSIGTRDPVALSLAKYKPFSKFQLYIGNRLQQSGHLDEPGSDGHEGGGTTLTLHGRDKMALLHDPFIESEQSFTGTSYYEFADSMLRLYGIEGVIAKTNENARQIITGVPVVTYKENETIEEILEDAGTAGVVYKTITTKLGEHPYHALKRHLDRVGLFFWCAPDGNWVLASPNAHQNPTYRITRLRGQSRLETNILAHSYRNGSQPPRYSECRVYARGGGRKNGRPKSRGLFLDQEMIDWGINRPLVIRDAQASNANQAEFLARRKLAEGRRSARHFSYTMAGHTFPSTWGGRAAWSPDTVVYVHDEELGPDVEGLWWIESVRHARSGAGTTSTINMMRPADLFFGGDA